MTDLWWKQMPQLSKGGKYVFGWSRVREDGGIRIPDEAMREYHLKLNEEVVLMSGSKTSEGFSVAKKSSLEQSVFSRILDSNSKLASYQTEEGETINFPGRHCCWVRIRQGRVISVPPHTLETYGVKPGDRLLSIRGSNIGFALIVRGPIVETAKTHPEIRLFE